MTRQDVCRQRGLFPSGNSPKETLLCKSFKSIAHVAGFVLLLEDCAPPNLPKDFFDSLNKYPPAKPGVFHRRVKPWNTSARITSRWYGLPVAKDCYLPPVNGLFRYFPSSTVLQLCLLPAGPYVFFYFLCIFARCVNVVPSAPELPVAVFILQFRVLFVYHQAALPFQVSHET